MTATCETPATESKRGRRVQSASVRSSSSEVSPVEVRPIIIISPRMEDCGPRVGCPAVGGSSSATEASLSETI